MQRSGQGLSSLLLVWLVWSMGVSEVRASPDPLDEWTLITLPAVPNSIIFGNGLFLVGSSQTNGIYHSTDGFQWQPATKPLLNSTNGFTVLGAGNGLLFASPNYPTGFIVSTNGDIWTAATGQNGISQAGSPISFTITYGNGIFICGQGAGFVRESVDGIHNWELVSTGFLADFPRLTFGNGRFLAWPRPFFPSPREPRPIISTTDGKVWKIETSGWVDSMVFGDGKFLVYINDLPYPSGDMWLTPDITRVVIPVAAFGSHRFLSGFGYNPAYGIYSRTVDGPWVQHNFPVRPTNPGPFAYGNGRFVGLIGGSQIAVSGFIDQKITLSGWNDSPTLFHIHGSVPPASSVLLQKSMDLTIWTNVSTFPVINGVADAVVPREGAAVYFRFQAIPD